jgi:hypothetical protein
MALCGSPLMSEEGYVPQYLFSSLKFALLKGLG